MPSGLQPGRPGFTRQRSNSVPVISLANVSAEEAGLLFSTAERAAARRKRPVSVDSPAPRIDRRGQESRKNAFNFSTPSRRGVGSTSLRTVQRSESVKTLPPLPAPSPEKEEEDIDPTPTAAPPANDYFENAPLPSPSLASPRRVVDNPILKSYADSLFSFTQTRLNNAAPQTLQKLGLKRHSSRPATPDLDVSELLPPRPPMMRSQFSDWSESRASSIYGPSSPLTPDEPRTPDEQCSLMTPDSFFAEEVTPRVGQNAEWSGLSSARPSSNIGDGPFFVESPAQGTSRRTRTDSVTSSEIFSYFQGFDSATSAAETRLSNDMSSAPRQQRLQGSPWALRGQFEHSPLHSPYTDMVGLARTPSWQVRAMG